MNKKQYNNVIEHTLKLEQTEDSLSTARAIFDNMGVALPQGDMKTVYETIKTDDYMGWKSCTMQEAQAAADKGVAAIGISEDKIVVLSANDQEQPVTQTASVMTLTENTSAFAVDGLRYYVYNNPTTQYNTWYFDYNGALSVDVGWKGYNQLHGNNISSARWTSSDTSVASVDYYSGYITAKKAGIVKITAMHSSNSYNSATFELWVRGKTPVFLIHGRVSHSNATWGIKTNIPSGANDHFDPNIDAEFSENKKYTDIEFQKIVDVVESNYTNTEKPCNLGYELQNAGYKENVNLFAFNYPNQDAVTHSAKKFMRYIDNLIDYVLTSGSDEMKTCFYPSKNDYINNKYKINIVGHSMGGLVARYFIENLYQDNYVDKLITICTPHWGSGYADLSNLTSIEHKLCDHDLDFDSVMFGGNNPNEYKFDENGCKILIDDRKCIAHAYELSNELQYSMPRNTKYYAIAGIDCTAGSIVRNDYYFEMSCNYTAYQQIADFMEEKQLCRYYSEEHTPKNVGDNTVGFLSQIGWTENFGVAPNKKIQMEKIFIDADTNGGNGGGIFVLEILPDGSNIFHSKVNHRKPVCDKVIEYLED